MVEFRSVVDKGEHLMDDVYVNGDCVGFCMASPDGIMPFSFIARGSSLVLGAHDMEALHIAVRMLFTPEGEECQTSEAQGEPPAC